MRLEKGLFVALAAALALFARTARADGPEPGEPAPDLYPKAQWVSVDGENRKVLEGPPKISEQQGKVVVILFFGTTDPSMLDYIKSYCDLSTRFEKKGLRVIGVSRENRDLLLNWSDENKIPFPLVSDLRSWENTYRITGHPYTYIADIYGEVAWKGDGNHLDLVVPQIELCLREILDYSVKREDTSKRFDGVWRALDHAEYPNALKFLHDLAKGKNEDDAKNAESLLKDLNAMADARLKRAEALEKRRDYVPGETVLKGLERLFPGTPQAKTAKDILTRWYKDTKIRSEIESQKLFQQGRQYEDNKDYKHAAECYRSAMSFIGTKGYRLSSEHLAELIKKGKVPKT